MNIPTGGNINKAKIGTDSGLDQIGSPKTNPNIIPAYLLMSLRENDLL